MPQPINQSNSIPPLPPGYALDAGGLPPLPSGYQLDQRVQPRASQPGFLDKQIPLTGPGNATLSGLQSIGRGVRSAVKGAVVLVDPRVQPGENADLIHFSGPFYPFTRMARGLGETASQATQIPGAIHDINQGPDPLGTYAKVAQETAGEGAGQSLTALATEGILRGAPKSYQALRQATRPARESVAESMITKLIKPTRNDVAFGKDPAGAIVKEGIVANNLDELGDKVYAKAREVGTQIDQTLQSPTAQAKTIDVSRSLEPIDAELKRAVETGDKALYNRLQDLKQQLTKVWAEDAESGTIVPKSQKEMRMTPYEATKFKRQVGDMTRWTGTDPFEQDLNAVKGRIFAAIKDQINTAVPDVAQLNERYANLASAGKAIERRSPVAARNSEWSLGDIGTAMTTAHYGGPAAVAAVAGKKILGSTAFKTRAARTLAGPKS